MRLMIIMAGGMEETPNELCNLGVQGSTLAAPWSPLQHWSAETAPLHDVLLMICRKDLQSWILSRIPLQHH